MTDSTDSLSTATNADTSNSPDNSRWLVVYIVPFVLVGFLLGIIAMLLGAAWWLGALIGLLIVLALAAVLYLSADSIVASRLGAAPVSSPHPRLGNLIEELCVRAGIREPQLHMVDSEEINAAAFGRSVLQGSLAVTTGALNKLSVVELEGLLAREVGRIRSGAAKDDTIAASVLRFPLAPLGGLSRKLTDWARGQERPMLDDMEGARINRYPPGLAGALRQIKDQSTGKSSSVVEDLWASGSASLSGAPGEWTLDARVSLLDEL